MNISALKINYNTTINRTSFKAQGQEIITNDPEDFEKKVTNELIERYPAGKRELYKAKLEKTLKIIKDATKDSKSREEAINKAIIALRTSSETEYSKISDYLEKNRLKVNAALAIGTITAVGALMGYASGEGALEEGIRGGVTAGLLIAAMNIDYMLQNQKKESQADKERKAVEALKGAYINAAKPEGWDDNN